MQNPLIFVFDFSFISTKEINTKQRYVDGSNIILSNYVIFEKLHIQKTSLIFKYERNFFNNLVLCKVLMQP